MRDTKKPRKNGLNLIIAVHIHSTIPQHINREPQTDFAAKCHVLRQEKFAGRKIMICPKCGGDCADGASFCTYCGNPLPDGGNNDTWYDFGFDAVKNCGKAPGNRRGRRGAASAWICIAASAVAVCAAAVCFFVLRSGDSPAPTVPTAVPTSALTTDESIGAVSEDCPAAEHEPISGIPDLNYTYWMLYDGIEPYPCKIADDTIYTYNANTGECSKEAIAVGGQGLAAFGESFVWNGVYFAGSSGKNLKIDPEEIYDYVCVSPEYNDYPEWAAHVWDRMQAEIREYEVIDDDGYILAADLRTGEECRYKLYSYCGVFDWYANTDPSQQEEYVYDYYESLQQLIDLYGLPLCVNLQIQRSYPLDIVRGVSKSCMGPWP